MFGYLQQCQPGCDQHFWYGQKAAVVALAWELNDEWKLKHKWDRALGLGDALCEGGDELQNRSLHQFIAAEHSSFAIALNPLSQ